MTDRRMGGSLAGPLWLHVQALSCYRFPVRPRRRSERDDGGSIRLEGRGGLFDFLIYESEGFVVVPEVLGPGEVDDLIESVTQIQPGGSALDRAGRVYASRNLLQEVARVRDLAEARALRRLVEPVLGPNLFPVRGLLFDKSPDVNWGVPWHQDLSIAVKERRDEPGFGPWTVKAGVPHVQPTNSILERMVTVRLQLDQTDADCGPLRVVPGSHKAGRLGAEETRAWLERVTPVTCVVPRGGALLMRPLLLHASSSSDANNLKHRRIIHLEYAADPLPHGLQWFAGS
jgi:Phytanoyl-CoA dioxygenase (PhyH)